MHGIIWNAYSLLHLVDKHATCSSDYDEHHTLEKVKEGHKCCETCTKIKGYMFYDEDLRDYMNYDNEFAHGYLLVLAHCLRNIALAVRCKAPFSEEIEQQLREHFYLNNLYQTLYFSTDYLDLHKRYDKKQLVVVCANWLSLRTYCLSRPR